MQHAIAVLSFLLLCTIEHAAYTAINHVLEAIEHKGAEIYAYLSEKPATRLPEVLARVEGKLEAN